MDNVALFVVVKNMVKQDSSMMLIIIANVKVDSTGLWRKTSAPEIVQYLITLFLMKI